MPQFVLSQLDPVRRVQDFCQRPDMCRGERVLTGSARIGNEGESAREESACGVCVCVGGGYRRYRRYRRSHDDVALGCELRPLRRGEAVAEVLVLVERHAR